MFIQHFWLLCGFWCATVNSYLVWRRLQPHVAQGAFSGQQVNRFTLGLSASVLIPMLLFWAIQQGATQAPSPNFLTWSNPHKHWALALQGLMWAAMLWFVFARKGDQILSTYVGVGYKGWVYKLFFSPGAYRVMSVLTVLSGASTAGYNLMHG